jgi:hypothetical protein
VALTSFGTNWFAFSKPVNQAETMDEKILHVYVRESERGWERERERERGRERERKRERERESERRVEERENSMKVSSVIM